MACGHSSVDGRLGNSRRDCRPGEGYSVNLGFDIRWGNRAGDRVGGGSECPERSRVEPNDPVGEDGEIDIGAIGEKDDGEAVVGVVDDERLVPEPAPRMLEAPVPEIPLEKPPERVSAQWAVPEAHRPQGLLERRATNESVRRESLIPAVKVVERRIDGAAPDQAVEGVVGARGEALAKRRVAAGAVWHRDVRAIPQARVPHPQGLEDPPAQKLSERLPR